MGNVPFTAADAGVIFDGAFGQVTNDVRVITLARAHGFTLSTIDETNVSVYAGTHDAGCPCGADVEHAADIVTQQGGIVDDAVQWLNDHAAPAGHWFTFDDGDFCLTPEEVESGDVVDDGPDTFALSVEMTNHAFAESGKDAEIARILRALASRIESDGMSDAMALRDANGNTCGSVEVR